jgi:hypothetical protein
MTKKLRFRVFTTALVLVCLTATIGYFPSARADIENVNMIPVDPNLTSPSGTYRWLDVADQAFGTAYQASNVYSGARVVVAYSNAGSKFYGTLTASDLKPNFAYQLKLVGTPGSADNEQIGFAGRWWQEEWNGATWINGQNVNDQTYIDNRNALYSSDPQVYRYRFIGYLVFDYFITKSNGDATILFETGSSYHVLWKTTQRPSTLNDGPTKTAIFDPASSEPAYSGSAHTVSIFGESERLPPVNLQLGEYNCQIVLTEESFHGSGVLAGNWAGAMTADLNFQIGPALPVPEYPLGALIALSACIAAFAVCKTTKIKTKKTLASQIA